MPNVWTLEAASFNNSGTITHTGHGLFDVHLGDGHFDNQGLFSSNGSIDFVAGLFSNTGDIGTTSHDIAQPLSGHIYDNSI